MTVRYRCPISTCAWFHEYVASSDEVEATRALLLGAAGGDAS